MGDRLSGKCGLVQDQDHHPEQPQRAGLQAQGQSRPCTLRSVHQLLGRNPQTKENQYQAQPGEHGQPYDHACC